MEDDLIQTGKEDRGVNLVVQTLSSMIQYWEGVLITRIDNKLSE